MIPNVWKNKFAPINEIPPETLALIPDFWNTRERDQDIIVLNRIYQGRCLADPF